MKIHIILKISICIIMITVAGIKLSQAQSKEIKEVEHKIEQLRVAMVKADGPMLNKLVADSLSYGHSGGQIQTKAQFIESITGGASVFVTLEFTDQTISITGNTAIVRHKLSASTNDKGKGPGSVELNILLVWVKIKGEWQLLARQAVKIIS